MARRVPLDNVDHQHLRVDCRARRVRRRSTRRWSCRVSSSSSSANIRSCSAEDSDGGFQAVAILGLDRGENLFLSEGEWTSRYVPATLRRGPLFLGVGDEDQPGDAAIVIDLDDPRVSDSEGEPLFLPHGGAAPFLQQAADALRTVHEGLALSRAMFAQFAELDLIAPVEINVEVGDGTRYRLPDLFTVDAGRFAGLSGAELESLNRAGFLAAAIHVRCSLGNINRLIELKTVKRASAADA